MTRLAAFAIVFVSWSTLAHAEIELSGSLTFQPRLFPSAPAHSGQRHHGFSLAGEVEIVREWTSGDRITIKPFARYDSADPRRSHVDLREAVWLMVRDDFELRVGIDKVFWGVTESNHLVDIINQTDLVENVDTEDKLGQPMVMLSLAREWGTVELFVLPYFRERSFPGRRGRLRAPLVVDTGNARFESDARRRHVDVAARYSHTVGGLDFGLAYFRGTSRDPSLLPGLDDFGGPVFVPFYAQIEQTSVDAQITTGPWLLKLEALYRWGQRDLVGRRNRYYAHTVGFEYTFFNIAESNIDIGVLGEHLFDARAGRALTPFENDVFLGARLAFNDTQDTQFLAGIVQDVNTPARNFFVEASRRLGDRWTAALEARIFTEARPRDLLFGLRRDDLIQIDLTYRF